MATKRKQTGYQLFYTTRNNELMTKVDSGEQRQQIIVTEWRKLSLEEKQRWTVRVHAKHVSGWNLYMKDQRVQTKSNGLPMESLVDIGSRWKKLSEEEKDRWNAKTKI